MNPLLGLLLKLTLLLCAAWGVTQALQRRSAAARHFVWLLAISGALLLPISSSLAPELPLRILNSTEASVRLGEGLPDKTTSAGRAVTITHSAVVANSQATPVSTAGTDDRSLLTADLSDLLLAIWLCGALFVLAWCALGHLGLARLVRKATPLSEPEWNRLGATIARQSGLRAPVRLFRSPAIGSPVIWGMRPIVLLPAEALSWSLERRHVVLAHEFAHAARGDYLAQLLACLACALFWFHPLLWMAARRLRLESERACDDQVLLRGTQGPDYAGHLLEVARRSTALRLEGVVAIGMARPSHLEGRLLAVLDKARVRQALSSRRRRLAWAALPLLIFPLSALRPAPRLRAHPAEPPKAASLTAIPAASDSSFEREVQAAPGGVLILELESGGSVVLRGWDEPSVRLHAVLAGPSWRDTRVTLERSPSGVRLHSWLEARRGTSSTSHSFELMVPRRFDVEVNSAGGEVTIVGLQGDFHGRTGGGALVIERATGRAELSTGGGDIRVADSELRGSVSTGGGEVRLSRVRGGLRGSSGSGPVISREGGAESGSLDDVRVEGDRIRLEKRRELEKLEAMEREGRASYELKERERRKVTEQASKELRAQNELKERERRKVTEQEQASKELRAQNELQERERRKVEVEKNKAGREFEPGALHIRKAGGGIILEAAPVGASLSTGGGHIEVGESAGFVEASTGGGNITIGPLAGSVRAGTGAGNVTIVIVDADGREHSVDIESGSGSVVLTLPAGFAGRFELEAAYTESFGRRTRITSDWQLTQDATSEWDDRAGTPRKYVRASGGSGGGGGLIRVRIVNGDITIRRGRS